MSKKTSTKKAVDQDLGEIGFEEAVQRLEQIIDRIERGEVPLEESLREYERGVALVRRCRSILDRAEQRVRELTEKQGAASDSDEEAPF